MCRLPNTFVSVVLVYFTMGRLSGFRYQSRGVQKEISLYVVESRPSEHAKNTVNDV